MKCRYKIVPRVQESFDLENLGTANYAKQGKNGMTKNEERGIEKQIGKAES